MKSYGKIANFLFKGFLFLSCLGCSSSYAQTDLENLVSAERNFAKYAAEHSTQEAFVSFLSPQAIIFMKGQAVNAQEVWKSRKPDSVLFSWYPTVADIASSGDLGYTAGPYEIKRNRNDKNAVAFGHYITIEKTEKWLMESVIRLRHKS